MRQFDVRILTDAICEMCIEANLELADDVSSRIKFARNNETSDTGKFVLDQLVKNMEIARTESIPICQDTGMAVVFLDIGQDVHFEGGELEEAVNEGIRRGYTEGYLRKSVVSDPFIRKNTNDNTPGIIHTRIVPGDRVSVTVAPKGFGSENMSRVIMLKPADGEEGFKKAVLETVRLAGPNACPPIVVGVGVGGDFELAALMAKRALTRELGLPSEKEHIARMEKELLDAINETGIGPGGLGGRTTALGVSIESYATHIAGMPVAVNICCHVNRHVKRVL